MIGPFLIDICFDANVFAILKFIKSQSNISRILYCPDCLAVGTIADVCSSLRCGELLRLLGPDAVPEDFEKQNDSFFNDVRNELEIRAWVSPSEHERCGLECVSKFVDPRTHIVTVNSPRPRPRESFDSLIGRAISSASVHYPVDIVQLREEWSCHVSANAELRVCEEGDIVDAGIDYFDDDIVRAANSLGNAATASGIAMNINLQREKKMGGVFPFYFLARRAMAIIPQLSL